MRWATASIHKPIAAETDALTSLQVGRMTQTWVRFPKAWRIVVGDVSVIEGPAE
jgi:AtzH-like